MTWRIEHTDSLTLLRELPSGWVHTCIAYPPFGDENAQTLAVLSEARRVLRDDGALWLFLSNTALLPELLDAGWLRQRSPTWGRPLALLSEGVRPLVLLTKQRCFFHRASALAPAPRRRGYLRRRYEHTQRCIHGRTAIRALARRCVFTTTAHIACGTCGAPFTRSELGEPRATCVHRNPVGRCLVLDPFYRRGHGTLEAADYNGRHFLGITSRAAGEQR